jgi:hypothetical protein
VRNYAPYKTRNKQLFVPLVFPTTKLSSPRQEQSAQGEVIPPKDDEKDEG